MSFQTWKEEFYPIEGIEITTLSDALIHTILKYSGYREENMLKHELSPEGFIAGLSCALCKVTSKSCPDCPLCDTEARESFNADEVNCCTEYQVWRDTSDPEPLIQRCTELLLEEWKKEQTAGDSDHSVSLKQSLENMRAERDQLKNGAKALRNTIDQLHSNATELRTHIGQLNQGSDELSRRNLNLKSDISALEELREKDKAFRSQIHTECEALKIDVTTLKIRNTELHESIKLKDETIRELQLKIVEQDQQIEKLEESECMLQQCLREEKDKTAAAEGLLEARWVMSVDPARKEDDKTETVDYLDLDNLTFIECSVCAPKPGAPELCGSCLNNRNVISILRTNYKRVAKVCDAKAKALDIQLKRNERLRVRLIGVLNDKQGLQQLISTKDTRIHDLAEQNDTHRVAYTKLNNEKHTLEKALSDREAVINDLQKQLNVADNLSTAMDEALQDITELCNANRKF